MLSAKIRLKGAARTTQVKRETRNPGTRLNAGQPNTKRLSPNVKSSSKRQIPNLKQPQMQNAILFAGKLFRFTQPLGFSGDATTFMTKKMRFADDANQLGMVPLDIPVFPVTKRFCHASSSTLM
jgi:hypothetical protein